MNAVEGGLCHTNCTQTRFLYVPGTQLDDTVLPPRQLDVGIRVHSSQCNMGGSFQAQATENLLWDPLCLTTLFSLNRLPPVS